MDTTTQPQPVSQPEVHYAGFWIRCAAYVIDYVIIYIGIFLISILLGLSLGASIDDQWGEILGSLLGLIIGFGYFILMTHKKGATFGKMAFGLTVVSEEGRRLSLGKIILRETLGKIVSSLVILIGYIMIAFTKKKQGLHDEISKSLVIYKDPTKKPNIALAVIVLILALIVPLIIIGLLSAVVLTNLNSAREKANEAKIQSIVATLVPEALLYAEENNSFVGFKSTSEALLPACSHPLIANVSSDGQTMAVFGKSCSETDTYYCRVISRREDSISTIKIKAASIPPEKLDCN